MRIHVALFTALFGLVGCAHMQVVEINSAPQGARVEFDNKDLGLTPIKGKEVWRDRNMWSNNVYGSTIRATHAGCTLTKTLAKDQSTPDRIFFDFENECPKKP